MSEGRGERRLRRLLDTNVCIHIIRRRTQAVLRRLEDYGIGEVGVSSVTVAELRYGAEKSSRPEQNLEALGRFLLPLEVLAFGGRPRRPKGGSGRLWRGPARRSGL